MDDQRQTKTGKSKPRKPLQIPLSFDQAVEVLLGVEPRRKKKRRKAAKKKPGKKKPG